MEGKIFLIAICSILFCTFVAELLIALFGAKTIIPAGLSLVTGIFGYIMCKAIKPSHTNIRHNTTTNDNLLENMMTGISIIVKNIRRDSTLLASFVLNCGLLISLILAWCHISGWIYVGVCYSFNMIDPTQSQSVSSTSVSNGIDNNDHFDVSDPLLQPKSDEPTSNSSVSKQLSLIDLNRHFALDSNEIEEIYFKVGTYMFENCWDDTEVFYCINHDIQILISAEKTDQYTKNASPEINAKIAQASLLESTLETSEQLDNIIECRKSIYEDYPMYTLAKLIAENYACFGLAYHQNGGQIETIEYYYGQAILWYREALRYHPTNEGV